MAAALGWLPLNFDGHQTPELVVSGTRRSRQLQADLADFPQGVCRTFGVATPHKGKHTKKGETGFES